MARRLSGDDEALGRQPRHDLLLRLPQMLRHDLDEHGALVREVAVERPRRHARFRRDLRRLRGLEATTGEHARGGLEQPLVGGGAPSLLELARCQHRGQM
jgi:hypothetical protein